jgi:hypothetical protein
MTAIVEVVGCVRTHADKYILVTSSTTPVYDDPITPPKQVLIDRSSIAPLSLTICQELLCLRIMHHGSS